MAIIRRGTIPLKFADALKLQQGDKGNPSDTSDKVVLTYDFSNANSAIAKHASVTTSGASAAVVYTCPTDKDFYLTSAVLTAFKDVACDVATGTLILRATIGNAVVSLLPITIITATAQEQSREIVFSPPIKIDRGSTINITGHTFTAGIFNRYVCISGFESEG